MKNTLLVACAAALLGALTWMAWPEPPAPGASPSTASARAQEARDAAPPRAFAAGAPAAARGLAREVPVPEGEEQREREQAAAHAAGCTGRLLEHDGRPLAGVEVTFLALDEDLLLEGLAQALLADTPLRIDVARDTTDEEGRFTLRGPLHRDPSSIERPSQSDYLSRHPPPVARRSPRARSTTPRAPRRGAAGGSWQGSGGHRDAARGNRVVPRARLATGRNWIQRTPRRRARIRASHPCARGP